MRNASMTRTTKETDITITLELDGTGEADIETGVGFFDHMLDAFTRHGLFDLTVRAKGDLEVDAHHTVEDVGIVLGSVFAEALADKRGINRFATQIIPMDESLMLASIDISSRGGCYWAAEVPIGAIETFDTQLAKEFFVAFATNAGITLHIQQMAGENAHHLIEAAFKACGRALCEAVSLNPRTEGQLPSTKGAL